MWVTTISFLMGYHLNLLLTTQETQGGRQWETGMPKAQGQSHQSNGATWLQTQADRMQD